MRGQSLPIRNRCFLRRCDAEAPPAVGMSGRVWGFPYFLYLLYLHFLTFIFQKFIGETLSPNEMSVFTQLLQKLTHEFTGSAGSGSYAISSGSEKQ
jgi:hypothetical protein